MEALWPTLVPIIGLILGAIATGLLGILAVLFMRWQNKVQARNDQLKNEEQAKTEVLEAQNRLVVLEKIGKVAAGYVEQKNKNDPQEIKETLAVNVATELAEIAKTPASPSDLLPHVLAGVAELPPTHVIIEGEK